MRRFARSLTALLVCAAMALLGAPGGVAEAALGAYRLERLSDGDIRYGFDEVSVTTPAAWLGKVVVMEYGDCAAFCHEASNRRWRQENGDETGGLLFALCVDETTDFREEPSCQELGRTDRGYYYLSFPTDLQAWADDEAVAGEYMALWDEIDTVRQSAEIQAFHTGPSVFREVGEADSTRKVAFAPQDAPYDGEWVPFEDGFRLYVPRAWESFEITGDEAAAGIFYRAGDGAAGAAVSYLAAGELQTPEDLARDFERAGFEGVERLELNGIEAVGFERPAEDYRGVAFFHPSVPGYILLVYASPLGEAGSVGTALLDSLTPNPVS